MSSTSIIALLMVVLLAIVELLVERGLDVNAQNCDGNTPLHLAMSPFQREVAKYLVDSGADRKSKT
jgi:ankyrin repeat protein